MMKGKGNLLRNIIFDLGGVLLELDVQKTFDAFGEMGLSKEIMMEKYNREENFFIQFEKGQISANEFRASLRTMMGNSVSNEKIDYAWNEMLRGFKIDTIRLLSNLSGKYPLYLLSNTNEIHLPFYSEQFREKSGGTTFQKHFTETYYSHIIGTRKPEPASFRYVLNDAGIEPKETLFIDDFEENCVSARETGLVAHQFKPEENLGEVLGRYGMVEEWEDGRVE
ncbi:MAG: HAD family phosphatase [Bacteroidetes bacterium]|nr:HAD family phosphatase [Bacteroidota bacterium]